jgi:hypothetical protein
VEKKDRKERTFTSLPLRSCPVNPIEEILKNKFVKVGELFHTSYKN